MASNVRYQIFVSSTYKDLYPVRRKVTEHILSMNHIPAGMEMFSASGREQWKTIQKAIDNSDYYVLIIGEKYGSISEDEGISYTQKEFEYARTKDIPTLCFLPGDGFSTSREHREVEPEKIRLLEEFKRKVLDEQLCDFWVTEDELVTKISAALYKIFTEEPGVGWIRGNAADPDVLSKLVKSMEENKRLQNKISEMESKLKKDIPTLSLKMNDKEILDNEFYFTKCEPDELVTVKPAITLDNISLTEHVSQKEIDEYNNSLPTVDDVDLYNKRLGAYLTSRQSMINFSIRNNGYVKANNASIRIHFPEDIIVLRESDVEKLKPQKLQFPLLPTSSNIMDRFIRRNIKTQNDHEVILGGNVVNNISGWRNEDELKIGEGNTIHGKISSVRQGTDEHLNPQFYLYAAQPGSFKVMAEILCDEYREWQQIEFTVKFE